MTARGMMHKQSLRSLATEGVTIVFSILLAFGINAAWAEHQARQEEGRVLSQLKKEMGLYLRLLDAADSTTNNVVLSVDYLLGVVHGSGSPNRDSVIEAVNRLTSAYSFANATATYGLLSGPGGFERSSSPQIRQAMSDVAAYISLVRGFENEEVQFVDSRLKPFLADHFDSFGAARLERRADWARALPPSRFTWSLAELRNSRKFSNLLVERRSRARLVTVFRASTRKAVREAQDAITGAGY